MSSLSVSTLGALLRRYRVAAGLSQEALAERAHLSREAISTLERGTRRAPRKETLDLLTSALGLSPAERAQLQQVAWGQRAGPMTASAPRLPVAGMPLLPLVGRIKEVTQLERHLAGEGPPLLVLAGEPGIGKTRLLVEASQRAREHGWTVLEGVCHRRSGQEPYAPVLGALEDALRYALSPQRRAQLEGCAWLVRLLPELAAMALVPTPAWTLPPEQERRLVFAAVARYLKNVAGRAGTLLVLDDLQWASTDALDLLTSLLHAPGERPLRVVGAYRSTEVRPADALGELSADLATAGLAREVRLLPLAPDEANSLLQSVLGEHEAADGALRTQLLTRTGGVPFFLISCARVFQAGATGDDLPWDVAQHLRQRIALLPQAAQELLGVAAIIGREASAAFLLSLALQPESDTLSALDALNQAGLLIEAREETVQFAHDLIREVVLADLSATRRRAWHRRVAVTLEQVSAEPPIERLAYHYAQAGLDATAVLYLEQAGDHAQALHANSEAEGYYRELVMRLEKLGRTPAAALAREKLSSVLRFGAQYDAALEALEQAIQVYQSASDREGLCRASAQLGEIYARQGRPQEGLARLEGLAEASQSSGASPQHLAALSITLARLTDSCGRLSEALAWAERAEALAHTVQDDRLLARAMFWRGTALCELLQLEEGIKVAEQAVPLAKRAGDLEYLCSTLHNLSYAYEERGAFASAHAYLQRALETAEWLGDPTYIAQCFHRRGQHNYQAGNWKQAHADYERAAVLLSTVGISYVSTYPPLSLGRIQLAEGAWKEALHVLEEARRLAERGGDYRALSEVEQTLAEDEILAGRPASARLRLQALFARQSGEDSLALYVFPLLAWANGELGEQGLAEAQVSEAIRRARVGDIRLPFPNALRVQALLHIRQQRWVEAQDALEESLALCQAMPFPYAEAKALYAYGLLHQAKGEPESARARFERALAILNRLGERLYAEHVERALLDLTAKGATLRREGKIAATRSRDRRHNP